MVDFGIPVIDYIVAGGNILVGYQKADTAYRYRAYRYHGPFCCL